MPKSLPQVKRSNPPWTPLQRRAWLTEQRHKGRLLPPPVLRAVYPSKLAWTWDLPNPYKWNVWQSLDGGVSYFLVDGYWMYGADRLFAPDGGGEFHYIVGVNTDGKEITQHSNAIRPDDAPMPVPGAPQNLTISEIGPGVQLDWTLGTGPIVTQQIYRKVDGGAFGLWQTVSDTTVTANDNSVGLGHLYTYRVQASNAAGLSNFSNEVSDLYGA